MEAKLWLVADVETRLKNKREVVIVDCRLEKVKEDCRRCGEQIHATRQVKDDALQFSWMNLLDNLQMKRAS